jgi:hypothetical protein
MLRRAQSVKGVRLDVAWHPYLELAPPRFIHRLGAFIARGDAIVTWLG